MTWTSYFRGREMNTFLAIFLLSLCPAQASPRIQVPVSFFEPIKKGGSYLPKKSIDELLYSIRTAEKLFNIKAGACGYQTKITPQMFKNDDYDELIELGRSINSPQSAWFIIGPRQSEQYLAISEATKEIPSISPLASIQKVFLLEPTHLTMAVRNQDLAKQLATEVAAQKGSKKTYISIVQKGCIFCREFKEGFKEAARPKGIRELTEFLVDSETPDLASILPQIESADPGYILLPNRWEVVFQIIQQLNKLRVHPILLGGDGWGDAVFGALPFLTSMGRKLDPGVRAILVRAYPDASTQLKKVTSCKLIDECREKPPTHSAGIAYLRIMEKLAELVCKYQPKDYPSFQRIYNLHAKHVLPRGNAITVNYFKSGEEWITHEVLLEEK